MVPAASHRGGFHAAEATQRMRNYFTFRLRNEPEVITATATHEEARAVLSFTERARCCARVIENARPHAPSRRRRDATRSMTSRRSTLPKEMTSRREYCRSRQL